MSIRKTMGGRLTNLDLIVVGNPQVGKTCLPSMHLMEEKPKVIHIAMESSHEKMKSLVEAMMIMRDTHQEILPTFTLPKTPRDMTKGYRAERIHLFDDKYFEIPERIDWDVEAEMAELRKKALPKWEQDRMTASGPSEEKRKALRAKRKKRK